MGWLCVDEEGSVIEMEVGVGDESVLDSVGFEVA